MMKTLTATASKTPLKIAVIIAAAGSSSRMGGTCKKEYLPFSGGTVLSQSAKIFLKTLKCSTLAVTVPPGGATQAEAALRTDGEILPLLEKTETLFVNGGGTRQESIFNALKALSKLSPIPDIVLIHDGARPFVTQKIITDAFTAAVQYGAAVPGIMPTDTQKIIDKDGFAVQHLRRDFMSAVQTPQAFRFPEILDAHQKAAEDGFPYTDDTEIWAKYAGRVKIVAGDICNKKITFAADYAGEAASGQTSSGGNKMIRTGLGYDIHQLAEGRKLMIGGVHIPYEKGEAGHSDGDVLLHAITDALLGASGLGDIGSFFPPEDDKWKDADSVMLLKTIWKKIRDAGWNLENLDCVIKLEQPKFLPFRIKVCESIADALGVSKEQVFVKAKTGEKLDSVGTGHAVEAWCTCLLSK